MIGPFEKRYIQYMTWAGPTMAVFKVDTVLSRIANFKLI